MTVFRTISTGPEKSATLRKTSHHLHPDQSKHSFTYVPEFKMWYLFKSGNNPTVTKLKHIWGKYINYEKLQINIRSGIPKTIYSNGSYLRLFEKRILKDFEISRE